MAKKAAKKEAPRKKKKKGNVVSLDFTGVKNFKTIPEGSYIVEVVSIEQGTSSNDNPTLNWEFEVAEGSNKGSKLWYTTTLTPDSMWKTREVLDALGQEIPDGEMDCDLDELVGTQCGVNVFHEEYEGKKKAKISDFISKDEVDAEDEEDAEEEDDAPKKGKKSKGPKISDMDEDELAEFIEENSLDVDLDDFSSIKKKRAAVAEAFEGGIDEDEEEEDSEKESESYTEDQINEMDMEELEALNSDHDLEVDLEDMKPKAARKAMLKALKKAKLLED